MIAVRKSQELFNHLMDWHVDEATVGTVLFDNGGRLSYPGRKELEYQLSMEEPYTLDLESRTIDGLPPKVNAAIRFLAREATHLVFGEDDTLDLLWEAHSAYHRRPTEGPSLDRLVAALVMVQKALEQTEVDVNVAEACVVLISGLHAAGFPPTEEGLEELFDGAPPACVGLGLVEL